MTDDMLNLPAEIASRFKCVEYYDADPEMGLRVLPMSGAFLRTVGWEEFATRLKAILPDDAQLLCLDGNPMSMRSQSDTFLITIGSMTWPRMTEGRLLPMLTPFFLRDAVEGSAHNLHAMAVPEGVEFRLMVNKQTHALEIPKGEETDDKCVVIVRPKS